MISPNLETGLTQQQARDILAKNGPNVLPQGKHEGWVLIFVRQFQSPLIYILLVAAVIIFFVGDSKIDAFIISGILFFNAIIGTIQEGRTSNILASLKRFIKAKSMVLREGKIDIIDDQDVVVGDIIILKEGERVPADGRVIYDDRLQLDESVLTGESKPIFKTKDTEVFKGTYIVGGSGRALITATGIDTQVGKLHKSIEEISIDIPLKRELNRLSYIILIFIFVMCLGLLGVGLFMGYQFNEFMVMLTALFICVVPEGLPVVLTLVLVAGAYRMAKQHVLIRNLQGVESLGRTDVIVIDKTGTLTRNEMMVTRAYAGGDECIVSGEGYFNTGEVTHNGIRVTVKPESILGQLGQACALLDTAHLSLNKKLHLFEIKGDPTEAALGILAEKLGFDKKELSAIFEQQYEIAFDSVRKYHAAFFTHEGKHIAYIVGAPEVIISRAIPNTALQVNEYSQKMLHEGLRIVAVGKKEYNEICPTDYTPEDQLKFYENILERDIELLGICGIQDAIRPEVKAMIDDARAAGLRIIMATGDHKETALYVAREVGIYKEGDEFADGESLAKISDKDLVEKIDKITVFARLSPQAKVRIIDALHAKDYLVAMTGDGINDVPSLLAADLGIAMGGIGTEVAKQAADLVLLDDSFVNVIHAIEQGRHIFYALRRVVLYFFATNMGEILIILFAIFSGLPLPLTATQILWLNFVTDGFLDIGLSLEPQEQDLLHARWLKERTRLVDGNLMLKMMYFAIPMSVASLAMFSWAYGGDPASLPYARTITLITMAMFQWFNVWNCRSEGKSLFSIGLFSNKWLIAATCFVLLLQFTVCYVPFMQYIFKTVPLSLSDWVVIFAITSPIIAIEELRKWAARWLTKSN